MSFAVPRISIKPQNHHDGCYFCMINISKYCKVRGRRAMTYPSMPSSTAPVPHSDAFPVPSPPSDMSNFLWVMYQQYLEVLRLDPIS